MRIRSVVPATCLVQRGRGPSQANQDIGAGSYADHHHTAAGALVRRPERPLPGHCDEDGGPEDGRRPAHLGAHLHVRVLSSREHDQGHVAERGSRRDLAEDRARAQGEAGAAASASSVADRHVSVAHGISLPPGAWCHAPGGLAGGCVHGSRPLVADQPPALAAKPSHLRPCGSRRPTTASGRCFTS